MGLFDRLFRKREYVFLVSQDKVLADDSEKELKEKVNGFISKELKRTFFNRKLVTADYYINNKTNKVYTIFCSFNPQTNRAFTPLIFEIHAFTHLEDERIFDGYDMAKNEFTNGVQTIKVFRIKL